jgi:tetratricopeptide (TPR) repeat protein
LPEAVSATQFLVPGLERDQIELIIEAPIKKAGAGIESALVQQLLTDVEGEPDQLPVLQHCLLQLWQQAGSVAAASPGRNIDFDCYDKVGKISGALSVHAEKILHDFREEAVEAVFRALSEIKDGRAIRRALPYAQLREECGIPDVELREVVDRFRADDCSFLVTSPSGVDVLKDDTVIDVGHEALLRRWERIRGAPGATGDSEDKRPIGWLRQERKDGRKYQILLSMLEGHRTSDEVEDIDHYWKWWNERRRTPQWAERYGGNYDGVDKLLRKGLAQQRKARLRIASLAAVAGLLVVFVLVQTYQHYRDANRYLIEQARAEQNQRLADDNFAQSIDITKKFLDETLFALNHGDMKVSAAVVMESVAQHTVERLQDAESSPGKATVDPSPRTLALEVALDNTATDILIKKKGSEGDAFPIATNAKNIAEKLVRLNAANDEWQKLLYESTFRYADLLAEKDPKAALPEYRSARDITQKLADKNPGDGEQQYHLAFVNVKIGEMFRDTGNNKDALEQLRLALEIAERLAAGHPDNPEWQAYAPSTMTKIGITLTRLPQPDYQGALAQYDAALARQNTLVEKFGRDGVIFSNMASSRIGKAEVLAKTGQWAQAKAEFSTAIADREKLAAGDNANVTALEYLASDYKKFIVALNDQAAPDMASASEPATDYQALFKTAVDAAEKEVHVRQTLLEIDPTNQLRIKSLAQARKTLEDLKGRISPPNQ